MKKSKKSQYYAIVWDNQICGLTRDDGAFDIDDRDYLIKITKKQWDLLLEDDKELTEKLELDLKNKKIPLYHVVKEPKIVKV